MIVDDPSLSLREVLDLPAVGSAEPTVLTDTDDLSGVPVTWVHVCEQADMTELVDENHLVLTSGIGLGPGSAGWEQIITALASKKASGLVIELHITLDEVPTELIDRANALRLPLIALNRPSRFVDITQSVHRRVADLQHADLQRAATVHDVFTRLMLRNASIPQIVETTARLLGAPTVLEDINHHVLAFHAETESTEVLEHWEDTARNVPGPRHPLALALAVVSGGRTHGRLVAMLASPAGSIDVMIAERSVAAIALAQSREAEDLFLREGTQVQLLADAVNPGTPRADLSARLTAFGFPVTGRVFYACLIACPREPTTRASLVRDVTAALDRTGLVGITAGLRPETHHLLVSAEPTTDGTTAFDLLLSELSDRVEDARFGVAAPVHRLEEIAGAFASAQLALVESHFDPERRVFRPADLSGEALLAALGDDPRLQSYVEGQLSALLRQPRRERNAHIETLHTYLSSGQNISVAARELFISRPALYSRLRKITDLLGVDLNSPKDAFSVHVAVTAYRARKVMPTERAG